ncbi:DUF4382 domain-containing protein [Thalassotalea aquiviva]|uniref:DUF4382 domain-containing protein n=1 Tax=Thalassotalea aquiviva TaxID=3242415 RepID=UPI00352A48EF
MRSLKTNKLYLSLALASSLTLLLGCSSDDDSDNTEFASFSLGVSDAPVDEISDLFICFSSVELKPTGEGEDVVLTVGDNSEMINANSICPDATNTSGINVMDFIGDDAQTLVQDAQILPGDYKMRVVMSTGSYAIDAVTGEEIPVEVPSNELKLVNTLTFAQGGNAAYTLEFDLKKSMVNAKGKEGYKLKPTGIRLVNNTEVGTLSGSVSVEFLNSEAALASGCTTGQAEGESVGTVYLYEGADVAITEISDISDPEGSNPPYATANILSDGANNFSYEIGYIMAGITYTAVMSCSNDTLAPNDVSFIEPSQNVVIEAETVTTINF